MSALICLTVQSPSLILRLYVLALIPTSLDAALGDSPLSIILFSMYVMLTKCTLSVHFARGF